MTSYHHQIDQSRFVEDRRLVGPPRNEAWLTCVVPAPARSHALLPPAVVQPQHPRDLSCRIGIGAEVSQVEKLFYATGSRNSLSLSYSLTLSLSLSHTHTLSHACTHTHIHTPMCLFVHAILIPIRSNTGNLLQANTNNVLDLSFPGTRVNVQMPKCS